MLDVEIPEIPALIRQVRIAMLQTRKERIRSILAYGSVDGRILRAFEEAFPEADLTAADDPGETPLAAPFDLIWAGSRFVHLSAARWTNELDVLERVLAPDGLLMFTTHGRTPAWVLTQLQDRPELRIIGYRERAWGAQDLVTCTK